MQRRHGQEGAVAAEYVFLLVLIALVLAIGVGVYGSALSDRFTTAATTVDESLG